MPIFCMQTKLKQLKPKAAQDIDTIATMLNDAKLYSIVNCFLL